MNPNMYMVMKRYVTLRTGGSPPYEVDTVVNVLDCDSVVSEFEL